MIPLAEQIRVAEMSAQRTAGEYRAIFIAIAASLLELKAIREREAVASSQFDVMNAAMRARHAEYYRERRVREKEPDIMGAGADFQFIEPHVFRTIRRVIDRDAIRQILANREGGIPIDSLMARIGGAA